MTPADLTARLTALRADLDMSVTWQREADRTLAELVDRLGDMTERAEMVTEVET